MKKKASKRSAVRVIKSIRARRLLPHRETTAERKWKLAVRERDDYTCRWPGCGYYSKHIHAHHVHTRAQRPDLALEVSNGACLCFKHHDYAHHSVEGRREARALGLLGTETAEKAVLTLNRNA